MHQDTFSSFDTSSTVQHLKSSHVVQDQTDGFGWIDLFKHRNHFSLRKTDVLAVAAKLSERGNHLTDGPLFDRTTALFYDSYQVVAWSKREWRHARIFSQPY